ncbi:hypothetical protein H9L39_10721 [Fusarium oxysporum f. sp. albedinis]|nr:hypothetical protein H9L39_10721 [Fusarium oxysporum f. sp. albedinis]
MSHGSYGWQEILFSEDTFVLHTKTAPLIFKARLDTTQKQPTVQSVSHHYLLPQACRTQLYLQPPNVACSLTRIPWSNLPNV